MISGLLIIHSAAYKLYVLLEQTIPLGCDSVLVTKKYIHFANGRGYILVVTLSMADTRDDSAYIHAYAEYIQIRGELRLHLEPLS